MSLNVVDAVSTTIESHKSLCDDEIIHIIEYYPQVSFSLVSKKFNELRQIAVFFSCRRLLSSYQGRSPYINESMCRIEECYSLSRRIGDYNYQEANRIMLYVMKNIFRMLKGTCIHTYFRIKFITSTDNVENFIKIENRALMILFQALFSQRLKKLPYHLKKQFLDGHELLGSFLSRDTRVTHSDMYYDERIVKIIKNWMNDEKNQRSLQGIRILKLRNRKHLKIIPQEIKYFKKLFFLDLSDSRVLDMSSIAGLTTLRHLYLSGIQTGSSFQFISDLTPIAGLTRLTQLSLSINKISDISLIARLTALTNLSLAKNKISDISPLNGLTALTHLSLSENQISDISPLNGLTALNLLILEFNQISDISPLAGLTALTSLYLNHNQISDINPITRLTALTHLDLSCNQVSNINPIAGLTALTRLHLYGTQVHDTDLTSMAHHLSLPRLEVMSLNKRFTAKCWEYDLDLGRDKCYGF